MTSIDLSNNILLIEDNPGDSRLVELYLDESDFNNFVLIKAKTLTEGMAILANGGNFAAILLDLMLPDSEGFETLEKIILRYPNNNIIVLTGLVHKTFAVQAMKAGAQDYLIKNELNAEVLSRSLRYSIERNSIIKRLEESQRIAHIGNWLYDPKNQIFEASDEVYRILGLSLNFRRFSFADLTKFSYPFDLFNRIHNESLAYSEVKKDIKIETPNDEIRYLYIQCRNTQVPGQKFPVLQGIIQDTTERKTANEVLMKTQERYQDIFTKSKDAIYIASFDGRFIDFNESTADLFGYQQEETGNLDINQLYEPLKAKRQLLASLSKHKVVKDFEIEIRRKDGTLRYCLLTANIVDTREFFGYNAILRDITEHKEAEELKKARDLAQRSSEMRERLLASISHEMRTPMNAIYGLSNLLIKTELNDEQSGYISSILQSSEHLLGIINDILEISSMQNTEVIFNNKVFDLYDLLMNVMNVMQHKVKEKDLSLDISIEPNVPRSLIGDKLRLNQILYNLVGNAIKFTEQGSVSIMVQQIDNINNLYTLRFIVADSGIGIPDDKVNTVFDTFSRIRYKDKIFEGTGLGLSIAKKLIEGQGGKIWVKSKIGEGSTFFFELAFELNNQPTESDNIVSVQSIAHDGKLPAIKVLLAEDNKLNQLVARKTLERLWEDIQLVIVENGQEAIYQLQEDTFDLVLMDIQMPIMDGYEAAQHIRNNMTHLAKMPIIAMTAHAHFSKEGKVQEMGMNDFVLKPFVPEQLVQTMLNNLQIRTRKLISNNS